jgi:hypothetical protein
MKLKTILISLWVLVILPTMTYALFFDTETSVGNTFSSSTLETSISPEFPLPIIRDISFKEKISFSVILTNTGQLDTQNSIFVPKLNNEKFSSVIETEVRLNEKEIFKGYLNELNISQYLKQHSKQTDKISFIFSISEENYNKTPAESVKFVIQNHAWQTSMIFGKGFYHNQEIDVALINPLKESFLTVSPLESFTYEEEPREMLDMKSKLEESTNEI